MSRLLRYLTCIALLASLPDGGARAQTSTLFTEDDTRTFRGGFVIGANFTQVDGDYTAGYNKVGLNVGPIVYAKLTPMLGASMELLFSQKGSKVRKVTAYGLGAAIDGYDMKLNYAEVPILLHITPAGRLHYSLGASYAYLIGSKEEAFNSYAYINLDPNLYPFRKNDFNFIAGLSYHIHNHWYINGRFAYSLAAIRDPVRVPEAYGAGNQKNNLFTLKLMFLF